MADARINADRLWDSLMQMAKIGATPKGGVKRLTLTETDRQGRDLFISWCKAAGLAVSVDGVGNLFARRSGRNDALPPVVAGSHLDTQPSGGRFDGCYGVMAALEVARSLNDQNLQTEAPFEVAMWTNEEGTRFLPVMGGSGAFAGVHTVEEILAAPDVDGVTFGDALRAIGYAGVRPVGGRRLGAYFEAHIEQGPLLENTGNTIGVVTGALGQRWFEVTVSGMDAHAGPTPMHLRRDALHGASFLIQEVNRLARATEHSRGTVGMIVNRPNSRNVVPGKTVFSVDFRDTEVSGLDRMEQGLRAAAGRIAAEQGLEIDLRQTIFFPPCHFDPKCVSAVRAGVEGMGFPRMDIVSGAGHDAVHIAGVAPTGMIFVPCEGGISHNEIENAKPEDLAAGCNVLLQAVMARAG
ncbi:MAG: Zn-dependent hydrolase [Betaproteobacteria bacterium]|nr:MAG: Zn-dependent hydrolase [Betaproteobacteria bacterium]